MKPDFKIIGSRLKLVRKASGRTLVAISKEVKMERLSISRIEQGAGGTIENLIQLVNFYRQFYDLQDLFSEQFEVKEIASKLDLNGQTAERLKIVIEELSEVIHRLEDSN